MVINGDQLRRNPSEVISAVQDFMNLEQVIKIENFVYDRKNGKIQNICFQKDENARKSAHMLFSCSSQRLML